MAWQMACFFATVEGSLQLAERAKRSERVKKLLETIKTSSKPVLLRIGQSKTVDIAKKSVDEIMDFLAQQKQKK